MQEIVQDLWSSLDLDVTEAVMPSAVDLWLMQGSKLPMPLYLGHAEIRKIFAQCGVTAFMYATSLHRITYGIDPFKEGEQAMAESGLLGYYFNFLRPVDLHRKCKAYILSLMLPALLREGRACWLYQHAYNLTHVEVTIRECSSILRYGSSQYYEATVALDCATGTAPRSIECKYTGWLSV